MLGKILRKNQSFKGCCFFLPGGPLLHHIYHGAKSPYFIPDLFPEHDFYMFDIRGLSCSSRVQSPKELEGSAQYYGIETFAKDFVSLKQKLVGANDKVIIFGGSFGGILGSQILLSHRQHVARAILFSNDFNSEWFTGALDRLNRLISITLPSQDKEFARNWDAFYNRVENGEVLLFKRTPSSITLTTDLFSVYLWIFFSQSVAEQEKLPGIVKQALGNDVKALEDFHRGYQALQTPVLPKSPPTVQSAIPPYYRCNVWSC